MTTLSVCLQFLNFEKPLCWGVQKTRQTKNTKADGKGTSDVPSIECIVTENIVFLFSNKPIDLFYFSHFISGL